MGAGSLATFMPRQKACWLIPHLQKLTFNLEFSALRLPCWSVNQVSWIFPDSPAFIVFMRIIIYPMQCLLAMKFIFTYISIYVNKNSMKFIILATYQALSSHMWLATTILDSADREYFHDCSIFNWTVPIYTAGNASVLASKLLIHVTTSLPPRSSIDLASESIWVPETKGSRGIGGHLTKDASEETSL